MENSQSIKKTSLVWDVKINFCKDAPGLSNKQHISHRHRTMATECHMWPLPFEVHSKKLPWNSWMAVCPSSSFKEGQAGRCAGTGQQALTKVPSVNTASPSEKGCMSQLQGQWSIRVEISQQDPLLLTQNKTNHYLQRGILETQSSIVGSEAPFTSPRNPAP